MTDSYTLWSILIRSVEKMYMFNFILSSFFCPHIEKNLAVYSLQVLLTTRSIHTIGLVHYLSTARNSTFYIRFYKYGNQCFVLF